MHQKKIFYKGFSPLLLLLDLVLYMKIFSPTPASSRRVPARPRHQEADVAADGGGDHPHGPPARGIPPILDGAGS